MNLQQIFDNTDFVHASGTKEELQVAEYLKMQCEKAGVTARLEGFRVAMGEIKDAHLYADGEELSCKAFTCCGSGSVEGELYYMPGTDAVSIAGAKDKIVLMDTQGIGFFTYQDLMKAGQKPFFSSMAICIIHRRILTRETSVRQLSARNGRCSVQCCTPARR